MNRWINGPRISRENNYNVLRMLGAGAVLYGHMFVLLGMTAPTIYANEVNAIGFKILMVLSGYMITQSCIYDDKLPNYVLKRVVRLLPAMIVYTLIAIFLIGPLFTTLPISEYFKHSLTWDYLYNVVLNPRFQLPACFADNPYPYSVNGSLWALPVEVSLYVIIYVVLKICCRFQYRKLIIGVVSISVCVLQICHLLFFPTASFVVWGTDWFMALNIYPYFFMGALYALTDIKKYCNIQMAFVIFLLSIAFSSNMYVIEELLAILILPYVLISIGECSKPVFSKILPHIDITYGMYLYGFPIQQILIQVIVVNMGINMSVNYMFMMSLFITVILATLSWFLVEKPSNQMLKKILKKKS